MFTVCAWQWTSVVAGVFGAPNGHVGRGVIVALMLCLIMIALVVALCRHYRAVIRSLRGSQERLDAALGGTELGIWEWHIPRDRFSLDTRSCEWIGESGACRSFSFDDWLMHVHPDDRTMVQQLHQTIRDEKSSAIQTEYRVKSGSGEWLWLQGRGTVVERDATGGVTRFVGTFLDVTQTKADEERMRLMGTVIEQAAEAVVITDAAGIIEYVNPHFETLTGYTSADAMGKKPSVLQSGLHTPRFYREMWSTLIEEGVWKGRFVNHGKDGRVFEEESTIFCVRDDAGDVTHYAAVKRDVTLESELALQLRQTQKMEALGTLAGGIAHDFNNILSSIMGYTELALQETAPDDRTHQHLTRVFAACRRAADLVAQILTFSRRRVEKETRPLLIHPVAQETVRLLRGSFPSTIEIQTAIDPTCRPILGDATQLHQIIMNLCTNAYLAMRECGGQLSVELREVDLAEPQTTFDLEIPAGRYVRLLVRDSGVGMAREVLDRMFDPYFTTRETGEGTGLGLATVRAIVKAYGGAIAVESQLGEGTTFCLYFPPCDSLFSEEDEGAAQMGVLPRGNGQHILVVDDDEAILQLVEIALRHLGYDVESYASSVKALAAFSAAPASFDLLITDQTMPNLTGDLLVQRVRALRDDLPVILCTGYSETLNESKALALGVNCFLMKPISVTDLAEGVAGIFQP
jgi:PAS domain S-box-containing protein